MPQKNTTEEIEMPEGGLDQHAALKTTLEALDESNPMQHYENVKQKICEWLNANHAKTLAQRGKIKAKLDIMDANLKEAMASVDSALEPITSSLFTQIKDAKQHMRETCMNLAAQQAKEEAEAKVKKKRDLKEDLTTLLKIFDENATNVGYAKIQKIYSSFFRGASLPPIEVLKKKELVPTVQNGTKKELPKKFQHTGISPTTKQTIKTGLNIKMWKEHLGISKASGK